jgi:hypothetical protein
MKPVKILGPLWWIHPSIYQKYKFGFLSKNKMEN